MADSAVATRRGSAKEYHERVTQLIQSTEVSISDAARTVGEEFGKTQAAVLNGYHRYARKLNGAPAQSSGRGGARRRAPKTVDGYLADARAAFEGALKRVSADVEDAQAELDKIKDRHSKDLAAFKARQAKELESAKAKLDDAKATVKSEKAKLEEKIKLLSA